MLFFYFYVIHIELVFYIGLFTVTITKFPDLVSSKERKFIQITVFVTESSNSTAPLWPWIPYSGWRHCGDTYRMTDYSVRYQVQELLGTNWGPWIDGGGCS